MSKTQVGFRAALVAAIAMLAWTLMASSAEGQQRLEVQGHGGLSIPTGRLADLADPGPSVGLRMSYPLSSSWAVRLNGDFDQLGGRRIGATRAPDMRLWRYGAGLERSIFGSVISPSQRRGAVRANESRWSLLGSVGAGATSFDSKHFTPAGRPTQAFRKTYLATDAGLTLYYDANRSLRLFAGTNAHLSFADEKDTAVLAGIDPQGQMRAFGSTVTVPVSAGFKLRVS